MVSLRYTIRLTERCFLAERGVYLHSKCSEVSLFFSGLCGSQWYAARGARPPGRAPTTPKGAQGSVSDPISYTPISLLYMRGFGALFASIFIFHISAHC